MTLLQKLCFWRKKKPAYVEHAHAQESFDRANRATVLRVQDSSRFSQQRAPIIRPSAPSPEVHVSHTTIIEEDDDFLLGVALGTMVNSCSDSNDVFIDTSPSYDSGSDWSGDGGSFSGAGSSDDY